MAVAQAGNNFWPRVYHRNPNVFDRTYDAAKFSYKIIQNSTGNVVYRGKSGTGEHDTLIIANTQADFTEISMAVGDYARANGTFVVLPEEHTDEQMPALGDYTAIITWQTFSDAGYDNSKGLYPTRMQQRMEVPFTIVDPITTVKGVRPTWNTPITVGQALTSSMQPSVVTSKS